MGPLGWAIFSLIICVVLALAGSKLARRSLIVIAVLAAAFVFMGWLLGAHA